MGVSNRKLTRTGLLEYHYQYYLYGDTSLFQLSERPQLHLLATNLSEGCLCSFNRNGMIMVRRGLAGEIRLDRIRMGLQPCQWPLPLRRRSLGSFRRLS
jgi:hypothetical protein